MRRAAFLLVLLYLLQLYSGLSPAQDAVPPGHPIHSNNADKGATDPATQSQTSPPDKSATLQSQPSEKTTEHQAPDPSSSILNEREAAVSVATTVGEDSLQPSTVQSFQDASPKVSSSADSESTVGASGSDIEPTTVSDAPPPVTAEPVLAPDTSVQSQSTQLPDQSTPVLASATQTDSRDGSPEASQTQATPPEEEQAADSQASTAQTEAAIPDKRPTESTGSQADDDKEKAATEPAEKTEEESAIPSPEQEDFPSFAEWKQKVLEEQEKIKLESQTAGTPSPLPSAKLKLRMNYASKNCGAKILASNPEAENTKGMLTSNRDDYMINPCTAKKWFHVELCEPVQVKSVEVASLELFSSRPKAFRIYVSDRYPVKEWRSVGTYETTEERVTQTFQINDNAFVKFMRVEIPEHHGSEHYCPITFFRVFGIEMADDDDDDNSEAPGDPEQGKADMDSAFVPVPDAADDEDEDEAATSLFNSAKDTVVKLVKKVLYTGEEEGKTVEPVDDNATKPVKEGEDQGGEADADISTPCGISSIKTDQKTADVPTIVIPSPTVEKSLVSSTVTPTPAELPMVTKLEDDEQIPHVHTPDPHAAFAGASPSLDMEDKALSCRSMTGRWMSRDCCGHRTLCSYVDIMLGVPSPHGCQEEARLQSLLSSGASESIAETPMVTSVDESTQAVDATAAEQKETSTLTQADHGNSKSTSEDVAKSSAASEKEERSQETDAVETEVQPTMTESDPLATAESPSSLVDHTSSPEPVPSSAAGDGDTVVSPTETWTEESKTVVSLETASSGPSPVYDQGETTTVTDELPPLEPSEPLLVDGESPVDTSPTPSLDSRHVHTTPADVSSGEATDSAANGAEKKSLEVTPSEPPSIIIPPLVSSTPIPTQSPQPTASDASASKPAAEESATQDSTETVAPSSTEELVIKATNVTAPPSKVKELVHVPPVTTMKRETAISRLTNRIKALELNVSLSSRFLDELSQRFKKQNEDMMKLLNKTIQRFQNATLVAERRDQKQQEQLDMLESRMDNLTAMVLRLADSVQSINQSLQDMNQFWSRVQLVLIASVVVMCLWRRKADPLPPELQRLLDSMPQQPALPHNHRRNSDITPARTATTSTPKRKSSDTALSSRDTRAYLDPDKDPLNISIVEPEDVLLINAETSKKKKKKKQKSFDAKAGMGHDEDGSVAPSSSTHLNTSAGLLFSVGGDEWEKQSHTKQSKLGQAARAPHKLSLGCLASQGRSGGKTATSSAASAHHSQPPFHRGHKRSNSHGKESKKGHSGPGGATTSSSLATPHSQESAKYCIGRGSLSSAEARGRGASFVVLEKGSTVSPAARPPRPPPLPPRLNGVTAKKMQSCDSLGSLVNGGSFGHVKKSHNP